jgi:hypothetical protein
MSSPIELSKSYEIGSRLAGYLPQSGQASPQVVLGLLSDLVGDEQALLAPLRHLVGLPGFSPLLKKAGTGTGLQGRDALLQSISQTYSSSVVIALGQFLDGLLALPVGSTPPSHPKPAANSKQQPPGPSASANPYTSSPPAPSISIQQGSQTKGSTIRLLVLAVVTALATATTALALRSGAFCSFGLGCAPGSSLTVLQGLDAAAQAGQSMDTATSLAAYGQALKALEDQLSSLNDLTPNGSGLTPDQSQRLASLQAQASKGSSRLSKERLDQDRLQQLSIEVDALSQLEPGQELQRRHTQAASSLGAISPTSFTYPKAKELQNRLDGIWDAANKQNSGTHTPSTPGGGSSANQRPAPPPSSGTEGSMRSEPLF